MFEWKPEYQLGFGEMDATHQAFTACVDAVLRSTDDAILVAFGALSDHLRAHFDEERLWMERTSFPSARCHLEEHEAVLKSLSEVHEAAGQGRLQVIRSFAAALCGWFPEHTQAMDMGLATWMVKCRLGGSPMVIRRQQSPQAAEA